MFRLPIFSRVKSLKTYFQGQFGMLVYKCEAVCVSSVKKALCMELKYALYHIQRPFPKLLFFSTKRTANVCGPRGTFVSVSAVSSVKAKHRARTETELRQQPPHNHM